MQLRRLGIATLVVVLALLGWSVYRYGIRPSADTQLLQGQLLTSSGAAVGGILTVNTDGSNLLNLTPNTFNNTAVSNDKSSKSRHPSASKDGSRIAFESNRDETGSRIFVMDSDGGNLRQVTHRPDTANSANQMDDIKPIISPDGSRIAFISRRGDPLRDPANSDSWRGISDIFVVNVDGSNLQQVTETQVNHGGGPSGSNIRSVAWSPD